MPIYYTMGIYCEIWVYKGKEYPSLCMLWRDRFPTRGETPVRVVRKASPMNNENDNEQEICPHCGVFLEAGSESCAICGNDVDGAVKEPALNEDPGNIECSSCGTMLDVGSTECFLCDAPVETSSEDAEATALDQPANWDLGIVGGDENGTEDGSEVAKDDLAAPEDESGLDATDILDVEGDVADVEDDTSDVGEYLEPESEADAPELPPLEPGEYHCPSCQKSVQMGAEECPSCWIALSEMIHCPKCSIIIPLISDSCPDCFAKLEGGVLLDAPDTLDNTLEIEGDISEPDEDLYSEEETTEYIEEFGVECPACNAFVSQGDDICSECGMLLVDDEVIPPKKERTWTPRPPKGRDYQKDIAIILVLILLASALVPFLVSLPQVDRESVSIDGQFGDWQLVSNNTDAMETLNPNVNIINYKLATDFNNVYFYIQTGSTGSMFGDSVGDNARIFIDVDQNDTTGYKIKGIGADYQIQVFGHDNFVKSAALLRFNNVRDSNDINGFESHAPAVPFAEGNELEVRVSLSDIGLNMNQPITAVYYVANANGQYDFSDYPATSLGNILHVSQSSAVAPSGLITGNAPVLNLNFTVSGDYALIDDIVLPSGYTLMDSDNNVVSFPLNITNTPEAFTVYFNTAAASTESFFTYEILAGNIIATDAYVVVQGPGAFAYVGNAPAIVNIDGAFADWEDGAGGLRGAGFTDPIDDVMDMERILPFDAPRLDLVEVRELQENDNINLYLDVEGDMFAGFDVPIKEDFYYDTIPTTTRSDATQTTSDVWQPQESTIGTRQASPDLQPPTEYKPQLGEDAVLVFIDINDDASDGFLVNGIGADRLLDIRGQYGKVTNITAYRFDSPTDPNMESWAEISASSAIAASDGTKMEASISLADLGMTVGTDFSIYFHVMDWDRNGDIGGELISDTAINSRRGSRDGLPLTVSNGWIKTEGGGFLPNATVIASIEGPDTKIVTKSIFGTGAWPSFGMYNLGDNFDYDQVVHFYATNGTMWGWNRTTLPSAGYSGGPIQVNITLNQTLGQGAPKNLTIISMSGQEPKVNLTWGVVSQPPGGFVIYRSSYNAFNTGEAYQFNSTFVTTSNNFYEDDNLTLGTSYRYYVASLDGNNAETYNSTVQAYTATALPGNPLNVYGRVFYSPGPPNEVVGATVTLETYNITGALHSWTGTTDAAGNYIHTLQPGEYSDGGTVWVNASIGDLRGFNWTRTFDADGSVPCNVTLYPPNIAVNKTVDLAAATPGQTLTYTLWVNNTDTWNATMVWVEDKLPDGVTYISDTNSSATGNWASSVDYLSTGLNYNWTFYNVTPGTHSFDIVVAINTTVTNGTLLTNWVFCNYTAVGNGTISLPGNYSWDNATTQVIVSNIAIGKTVDMAFAYPGDVLTYTIYFNNSGGMDAVYMWINDTLPAEVTFIDHTADVSPTSGPYFQNFNQIGQGLFFEFMNVPVGTHEFEITVRVNPGILNDTTATNWVFCNYTTEFTKAPESNASASTTIIRPDIIVNKTVDLTEALPGDYLNYTITFDNNNATAYFVWLNDTLPAGVVYVSDTANLVIGATLTSSDTASQTLRYVFSNVQNGPHSFEITARIYDSTPSGTWLNNTVICDYASAGYTTIDNASTLVIQPIIGIDKMVNQTYALPGETVTYTIWFNNTGTANASFVWITDTLPIEVIYISDNANLLVPEYLSSGNSGQQLWFNFTNVVPGNYSFDIVVQLNDSLAPGTPFPNWAYIEYAQDNGLIIGPIQSEDAIIIVLEGPYIDIVKQASQTIVNTGEIISYIIYFNNSGNGNASTVWLNDTLPAGVVFNSSSIPYDSTDGITYYWVFNDVAGNTFNNFLVIDVLVTSDTDMDFMINTATCEYVSDTGVAGIPSSDSADITLKRPIISVSKTVDKDIAAPGDLLVYTINFDNTGSFPADVWINDTLPAGVTYIGYSYDVMPDAFDNSSLPLLTWYFAGLPVGSHWINLTVQVDVATPSGTELNNTVQLSYSCPISGYVFPGSTDYAVTLVSAMIVDKTVDLEFANPGDFLNYTIYFNNISNFTISNVWLNDTLPIGVTYVSDTAADLVGIFAGSWNDSTTWNYNFTNVGFGYNSFVITVQIDANLAPGTWVNNSVEMDYTNDVGDMMPGSSANASTMVNRPIIDVVKTVNMPVANPGDVLTYTIWFNNTGSINASHVWLNDTLPSFVSVTGLPVSDLAWDTFNATTYSFYFTDVPVGNHYIIFNATILLSTPDDTYLVNTVVCEYETDTGTNWTSSDNATTWVVAPIITVEKSASVTTIMPGGTFTYTIWFNNSGSGDANIWINDTLPGGVQYLSDTSTGFLTDMGGNLYSWYYASLAPGYYSFTITVSVNLDVWDGEELVNHVLLEYEAENGQEQQTDEDWANVTAYRPVIVVEKTVNLAEANPGDTLVYTIYFNNTGGADASSVWLEDVFPNWLIYQGHTADLLPEFVSPEGLSGQTLYFNFTNVAPGDHSFTITFIVDSSAPDCPTLVNTVNSEYEWGNQWLGNQTTDNATTHINRPVFSINKVVDYAVASPGFFLNYTITFTNNASGIAAFVGLNDTLPDGVVYISDDAANLGPFFNFTPAGQNLYYEFTDVPGFSTYTFTITVWINDTYGHSAGDELWNWVWINYTAEGGYPFTGLSDSAVTVITDMAVSKSVNQTNAAPGDSLQYTIWFNNTSGTNLAYVWINDTLPSGVAWVNDTAFMIPEFAGSWNDGTVWYYNFTNVAPGDHSFVINVTIGPVDPGTILENIASLDYTNTAGVGQIGSADNATTLVDEAIMVIEKTVDTDWAEPGDTLIYTIWYNNTGQATAADVWVNDTLPVGVTYVSDTNGTVIPVVIGTMYSWHFTNLAPGIYPFTITVTVNDTVSNGTVLVNTATLGYQTGGYVYEPSIDWANTTIYTPILTVDKVVNMEEATIGDTLTYTIYINNTGRANAYINLTDILDVGLTLNMSSGYTMGNHTFVSVVQIGQILYLELDDLAPGEHIVTFNATIDANVAGGTWLANWAFVNYTNNNSVSFPVESDSAQTLVLLPDIMVLKWVDRWVASPGDLLTYTIDFSNFGSVDAGNVWINDTLPVGVSYVSNTSWMLPEYVSSGIIGQDMWFNFSNVAPGFHYFTITVQIDLSVAEGDVLTNNVTLNYTATSGMELPGSQDSADTIITMLAVVKTVSDYYVQVGQNITYTIYFNNTGNFTIPYLWINDTLDPGVTYIIDTANATGGSSGAVLGDSWDDDITWYYNFTDVEPGSHWFTITANVDVTNAPGNLIFNYVGLNYTDAQGNEMMGSDYWAVSEVTSPMLSVDKAVDLADAVPGDTLTYTITITNIGSDATGMIWVNDTLPGWLSYSGDDARTVPYYVSSGESGGMMWFNFTGLPAGSSFSFDVTAMINLNTPDMMIITNWAFVNYTSPSGYHMGEIYDNVTTLTHRPIISVTKTVDLAEANPGDTLIYTIWVDNTGSGTAGDLWINDTFPVEVQYVMDSSGLPIGDHITIGQFHSWHFTDVGSGIWSLMITVNIYTSVPSYTWINNSALWEYTFDNGIATPESQNLTANATTLVIAPVIDVDKIVDLNVAAPGELLTYTIWFNNSGEGDAATVWINDTLPSGVSYVWDNANVFNWTAGLTRYYTFTNVGPGVHSFNMVVIVNANVFDSSILNNTVTCDYAIENGYRFARTSAWAETQVQRPIGTFAKTASTYYVSPNEIFNYTVYFNNSGSGNAASVWIIDILPVNLTYVSDNSADVGGSFWQNGQYLYFNFTGLPTGDYWFNVEVQVSSTIINPYELVTNWAFCNYSTDAGQVIGPLNNSADVVIRRPIITVEKVVNLATASYNETLTYTIWFNNTGVDVASFVWLNDTLPTDVTYVSDTNATEGGIWTGYWNWTFTNVEPGEHSFNIVVTVNAGVGSPVTNNVTLNYTASNDYPLEESWGEVSTIITAMAVVKVATNYSVTVGQQYNYTIWFNNTGGSNSNFAWINDTLPAGVIYVNDSAWQHSNFAGSWNNSITWYFNFTNVAPGVHWLNMTVRVNNVAPNTELWNTAQLNYTDNTGTSQPGSLVHVLTIVEGPIIEIVKTVDMSVAYPNDYLNYSIYINNTGTGSTDHVWVNDTLPSGVTYILNNASDTAGYFSEANVFSDWYFEFDNLAPGNYWFWILVQVNSNVAYNTVLNNTVECFYNVSTYGWSGGDDYALTRIIRPVINLDKAVDLTIASPNDILTYAIWFNNTGSIAPYVWINDTLPFDVTYMSDTNASCPGVSNRQFISNAGGVWQWLFTDVAQGVHFFTITVRVDATVSDGQVLTNWVTSEFQLTNGFTESQPWVSVETTIGMAEIQIVKQVDSSQAYPNDILTYTVWYNNTGSQTSPWVTIDDILPIGVTYNPGSAVGAPPPWQSGNQLIWNFTNVFIGTHSFTFKATINADVADGTILMNDISCYFELLNGYTINDGSDTASTWVIRPMITVEKIVDMAVASPGDYLTYTVYYNNTGSGRAKCVWINEVLPPGIIGPPTILYTDHTLQVTADGEWRFSNVDAGNYMIEFRVQIRDSVSNGTLLTNWAFCNYSAPNDLIYESSSAFANTLVSLPEINIVKIADISTTNPGGVIVYTIYFNNTGGADAYNVIISDTLPEWVTYYSDNSGVVPSRFGQTYTWVIPVVSQGMHSFNITVNVSVSLLLPDGEILVNMVVCQYNVNDVLYETTDHANVTAIRPMFDLEKYVNLDVAYPNDILIYTIEFNNMGSDIASQAWINDTLPSWTSFIIHNAMNISGAVFDGYWINGNDIMFNFTDVTPGPHNFTIYLLVDADVPDNTYLTNSVRCEYKASSGLTFTPLYVFVLTPVRRPIIGIDKIVNASSANPGEYLTYTIFFNNTGSGIAANLWINETLPFGLIYLGNTSDFGMGILTINASRFSWYFQNVGPGVHSFELHARIDVNIITSVIINNATCEYQADNGFNYIGSYAVAVTLIEGVSLIPPEITTTPPEFVYAGFTFDLTALLYDVDGGIVRAVIYYIDIEGVMHSGNMTPTINSDANGNGYYSFTVEEQMWKGIVSYYVWAMDTDGLTNRTGYYDVRVVLPPYYVWGNVVSSSSSRSVLNSMIIIYNNATNETVVTRADESGFYILDLGKFSSGYLDGQGITVKAIDADLLWYGYSYGVIDITRYVDNPELPPDIWDSGGHPYQNIDIYLTEIPEFSNIFVPLLFMALVFIAHRRQKKRGVDEEDN